MKKVLFSFLFYLLFINSVSANDGFVNQDIIIGHNKITCISISNLDDFPNQTFIFDYSSEEGQLRNKPWTVIEKGKCYAISSNPKDYYTDNQDGNHVFVTDNLDFIEEITAYNNFDVKDNLFDFIKTDNTYRTNLQGINIFAGSPLSELLKVGDFLIITDIIPVREYISDRVTSGTSVPLNPELDYDHPAIVGTKVMLESLAQEFNDVISQCDERMREEIRLTLHKDFGRFTTGDISKTEYLWRFNLNIDVPKPTDSLESIELIGCKEEYANFLEKNNDNFRLIEKYAETLRNEYPDLDFQTYSRNSDAFVSSINNFVTNHNRTDGDSEDLDNKREMMKIDTSEQSQTDDTTLDQKINYVLNNSNTKMIVYWLLPIIGILLIIFYIKKKK